MRIPNGDFLSSCGGNDETFIKLEITSVTCVVATIKIYFSEVQPLPIRRVLVKKKKHSFLYLFAPARRAPVLLLDDDTVPLTVRALRLHLLRHPGGDLVVHHFEPSSLAPWTLFEVLAPAPLSPARGANHVFAQLQFGRFAVVQVLERHFQRVDGVFAFVPPPVRPPEPAEAPEQTAAEQVREQAVTPEAVLRPLLHPLEAILVVNLPLLRVGQDLVRVRDLLELVPGLGILVGVEFFR